MPEKKIPTERESERLSDSLSVGNFFFWHVPEKKFSESESQRAQETRPDEGLTEEGERGRERKGSEGGRGMPRKLRPLSG